MARLPYGTIRKVSERVGVSPEVVYRAMARGVTRNGDLAAILTGLGLTIRSAELTLASIPVYQHSPQSTNGNVSHQRFDQRKHWEHNAARRRLKTAQRSGLVRKAAFYHCVDCGKQAKEYDHYLGYAEVHALVVHPVCRSCHVKRTYSRS